MAEQKSRRAMNAVHRGSNYTDEEREFMMAMDAYKRKNRRPYPTWAEVLAVVHSLGYRKVTPSDDVPQT